MPGAVYRPRCGNSIFRMKTRRTTDHNHVKRLVIQKRFEVRKNPAAKALRQTDYLFLVLAVDRRDLGPFCLVHRARMSLANVSASKYAYVDHTSMPQSRCAQRRISLVR